jgi:hypothetical protein
VYRLETFDAGDIESAERLIGRYRELEIGLADASLVVLANRYGVRDLLTLDERHFRTLRGPGGRPFRLLPADAALPIVAATVPCSIGRSPGREEDCVRPARIPSVLNGVW